MYSNMNFSQALIHLKHGEMVRRRHWKNVVYIKMQEPSPKSKMTGRYIYCVTPGDDLIPWLCSNGDMFAEDWEVYNP